MTPREEQALRSRRPQPDIIERVERGEEIIIDRAGTPVAKVVPLVRRVNRTAVGSLAGQLDLSGDWDSPLTNAEIAADFHAHAITAGRLPPHHRDPFDRMLVAQAITERLTLASRDPSMALYDVDVVLSPPLATPPH